MSKLSAIERPTPSDLAIAQAATVAPLADIAAAAGLEETEASFAYFVFSYLLASFNSFSCFFSFPWNSFLAFSFLFFSSLSLFACSHFSSLFSLSLSRSSISSASLSFALFVFSSCSGQHLVRLPRNSTLRRFCARVRRRVATMCLSRASIQRHSAKARCVCGVFSLFDLFGFVFFVL